MNALTKKAALMAAVACPVLIGAQSASAALITSWSYNIDSTFSDFAPDPGVDGSNPNDVLGGSTRLEWGTDDTVSSIEIDSDVDSPPNPPLVTNGPGQAGASFTHNNRAIPFPDDTLESFTLQTQIRLDALTGEDGFDEDASETVGPINFNSFFTETLNEDSNEDCVEGSTSNCDDIFVLANAAQLGAIGGGQNFDVGGRTYTVFLDILGLGTLTDAQCDAAGADSGCTGFLTEENSVNNFDTKVRITSAEVPEPGTLALLGLGLAGLGFASRSRKF